MTVHFGEEKPRLQELAHYGVKGMKWGQRKATITGARRRQAGLDDKVGDAEQNYLKVRNSGKSTTKVEAALQKTHNAAEKNRLVAGTATRGEQVALLLIGGPLGALVIAGNAHATRDSQKIKPYNTKILKNVDPED